MERGKTIARTVPRALLVAVLIGTGAVSAWAQSFIEGTEDVPLAPTLVAVEDAGMVFDSPSGRIVEAFASGSGSRDKILAFYAETLPELGWQALGTGRYQREQEQLAIDFFGQDGALSVRFTISPE